MVVALVVVEVLKVLLAARPGVEGRRDGRRGEGGGSLARGWGWEVCRCAV
jgi:hypothetical protein